MGRGCLLAAWGCVVCLLIACFVALAVAWCAGRAFLDAAGFLPAKPWHSCRIETPDGKSSLVFMQRPGHQFLAEYSYKLRFEGSGSPVERPLPYNCGGRTMMSLYWHAASNEGGPWVRFEDRWGEYLADLGSKRTFKIVRCKERVFLGEILKSLSETDSVDFGGGRVIVEVDGREALEITGSPLAGTGSFFGRIDGQSKPLKFIPASKPAEAPAAASRPARE